MHMSPRRVLLPAFILSIAATASAHTGHHDVSGFQSGLTHPIFGLDHLLAMIAVGLWAAQLGGRALWVVPTAFVALMLAGGAIGMAGLEFPGVEWGITGSVLVLGVLIAAVARLPLWASVTLVGAFALCHGQAHGTEMPSAASPLGYALGFLLATAALHLAGIGLGFIIQKLAQPRALRACGGAVAVCGLVLMLG
jgi:urease accessory protein